MPVLRKVAFMGGVCLSGLILAGCDPEEDNQGLPYVDCPQPNIMYPDDPRDCKLRWGMPFYSSSYADPSQIEVDYTGSTVALPNQGHFVVTARNANGVPVSLGSFSWTRNGSVATIDDAYAASQWVQQLPQGVSALEIETVEFLVQPHPGLNILMTEIRYGSTTIGIAADVWTQAGSGGCQGDQTACIE